MNTLHALVEKYGSDKNRSGYTDTTYFELFDKIKEKVTDVLEIGLGTLDPSIPSSFVGITSFNPHYKQGGSLRVWRDFFVNANIYGVDIAKDCMFTEERIKTFLFDSAEPNYVDYYLENLKFDIIIDDGNHDPKYQIKTLRNLLPKLREGGYYIIEDVGGYGGNENLLTDYLEEFNTIIDGCTFLNKGNHIVIEKNKKTRLYNTTDLISKTLHYIGKNNKDAQVIQIGAMDGINFDDTRGFLDLYRWPSLLVEPIPALHEELKNNFKDRLNYSFEQCAIADYNGFTKMLTVPPEVIEREGLHPGYKGMSAMYPLRNGFGSDYQRDIEVKGKFGIDIQVPTLTFESLLHKHNISNFDILICDAEGYDWNIFKQIDLKKYRPKFIRLEYINLTEEEKKLTQEKLEENGYIVDINQDIDAVLEEFWNVVEPGSLTNSCKPIQNNNLTVVTGLWNLGRSDRDFSHYIENFKKFLDIPINMFIYVPANLEHIVWEKRSRKNTFVRLYELEDVKNIYKPFWDRTQQIRTSPSWLNITGEGGWLKSSPQASLEWYNPVVQSKMFLLNDVTIWNPLNTEHFLWLDAGITNTVYEKLFTDSNALDKIDPYLESFLFLSYPYQAQDEIHGFDIKAMNKFAGEKVEYVCRGGLFGGTKNAINSASALYYSLLDRTLSEGVMGTEESIFSIMSYLEPEKYRRYALDGNGLVFKFVQALIDDEVVLEPIPEDRIRFIEPSLDTSKLKTSLYMLTFNFPEQLRYTLEKYKKHTGFLDKTRKILIDNSNNDEAIKGNRQICEEYGFEHIITGENLGINRGRFKAAEHFDQSDSDYYIFLEDDMGIYSPEDVGFCRNGFRKFVPDLYEKIHKIMLKEKFDFLKLTFTEVFMDNYLQVSWYNVPQSVRTEIWPHYDKLPIQGLDFNCPRTVYNKIDVLDELAYAQGEVYYANWPMIVGKEGNRRMFLDTVWANPFEQTWMSHMFQETRKGNLRPAVLLASPIEHNRIVYYKPEERREN
jgi:FkbM family methyltransferase